MKVDKSLQEVWDWKEKIYNQMRGLSAAEKMASFKKASEEFCKRYGVKFKKLQVLGR